MSRNLCLTWLLAGGVLACETPPEPDHADHPPLVWEGERVVFGTDQYDEVCAGTLAWLDATVVSIEAELELEPSDDKIEFVLVDAEVVQELCGTSFACFKNGMVYSSPSGFMHSVRHELVHARLAQVIDFGKPLFDEGMAAALENDGGCLTLEACSSVSLDALLLPRTSLELADVFGYTPGADLVHGMLVTYGPAAVLAFMDELTRDTPPDAVRSIYLEHFGNVLDEDFQAFMRGPFDDYTIAQRGCDSLLPIMPSANGTVAFMGVMDCGASDVVNYPVDSARGMITSIFEVTPEHSGAFVVQAPEDAFADIDGCWPPEFGDAIRELGQYNRNWPNGGDSSTVFLAPGQYSLRWVADFGSSVDVQLVPPCTFETGGCPPDEQCTIWNECRPEVESPAALGQTCEQQPGAPLSCEAGTRCMGSVCVAECDSTQPCADGQACSRLRVCGAVCDLLAQDCEPGFNCMPTGDDDPNNASGLGACIAAGEEVYLGNCDLKASECGPGLSCEGVPGPSGSACSIEMGGGCCVPYCDASAAVPDCPDDMPDCDPIRDGPVGVCRKIGF